MSPFKHLIALGAMLFFSTTCQADAKTAALTKEIDLMMDACREARAGCASAYLKKRRQDRHGAQGRVSQEEIFALYMGAWMLHMLGEVPDAEAEYKLVLALSRKACATSPDETCTDLRLTINNKLAQFYLDEKRYAQVPTLLREVESLAVSLEEKSRFGDGMVTMAAQMGDALAGLRRYADAEAAYLKAKKGIDSRNPNWDKQHFEYWPGQIDDVRADELAVRRAAAYQRAGNKEMAMRLLAPVLAGPETASPYADALDIAATIHLAKGEEKEAQPLLRRALALREVKLKERCTVRWIDAEKLAQALERLAASCRADVCKSENASLRARATKIFAAPRSRPLEWNRQQCR